MSESAQSDRGPVASTPKDSFGLWLGPRSPSAATKPTGPPKNESGVSRDISALRAFRAGKGPLASLVSALDAPDPAAGALPALPQWDRKASITPLKGPATASLVTLMALAVAAGYAVRSDLRTLWALRHLESKNQSIHEYNYSRNILVRNLARDTRSGMARLKGYDAWMDNKIERGVIVFTPQDGQAETRRLMDSDFADHRPPLLDEVELTGVWTPPPPLKNYDDLRFERAEMLSSRLPVSTMLALAVAAMIVWSIFASRNLPALDAPALCTRPLAVLASWLTPVANLYLPCAIMGDIWQGSDPRTYGRSRQFRLPVVGLWWLAMLAACILLAFSISRMAVAIGPAMMVAATRYALYADLGAIVVGVLTIGLVIGASWNQSRRYRLVVTTTQELGPSAAWHRD
ncbi:MAG: DUF4328 domain-containing protein [Phycisphaerae bacterium]